MIYSEHGVYAIWSFWCSKHSSAECLVPTNTWKMRAKCRPFVLEGPPRKRRSQACKRFCIYRRPTGHQDGHDVDHQGNSGRGAPRYAVRLQQIRRHTSVQWVVTYYHVTVNNYILIITPYDTTNLVRSDIRNSFETSLVLCSMNKTCMYVLRSMITYIWWCSRASLLILKGSGDGRVKGWAFNKPHKPSRNLTGTRVASGFSMYI